MADVYAKVTPGVFDSTNQLCISSNTTFWPYNNSYGIYHCPADISNIKGIPRVRSYSMNGWIATKEANGTQRVVADFGANASNYLEYEKDSDVRSPATTWYLIDEHEKSINDVLFLVAMPTLGAPHR